MPRTLNIQPDPPLPRKPHCIDNMLLHARIHTIHRIPTNRAPLATSRDVASNTCPVGEDWWTWIVRPPWPADADGGGGVEGGCEPVLEDKGAGGGVVGG